eukprot:TRINITY_DN73762_c0_g1_i1.p1 TRINITY_DN73762_c0_g1~~TRINITY_DN73762_c0_g1_i1.p1  ORF type:complete len:547 (-),score=88.85 TRINITY_DN73762_c0_g1_i1:84-1562(-)
MAGSAADFRLWENRLAVHYPDWRVRSLASYKQRVVPILGDGLDEVAALAEKEIVEILCDMQSEYAGPVTLHCIGHSMGGLILRGALPGVFEQVPDLLAGTFLSLSVPHLGVQASWGDKKAMWRNLSKLTAFISPQLPQLAVQDGTSKDSTPYLVKLAKEGSLYIRALRRFRRRICVTMLNGDIVIPAASGSLWTDRKWDKPAWPASLLAGWGFEAYSVHEPDSVPESPRCPSVHEEEDVVWTTSADGACSFPKQIEQGLLSMEWERLVVRLHIPKATVHVFTIAKAQEQSVLEHLFSCECVEVLVPMLAGRKGVDPTNINCPSWAHEVALERSPREHCYGKWTVALEDGVGNVKFYPFFLEQAAHFHFDRLGAKSRILFDPLRVAIRYEGANQASWATIRRAFEHQVSQASLSSGIDEKWLIGSEEGIGNVKFYMFQTSEEAYVVFNRMFVTSRILFNPERQEVARKGWNPCAFLTISKALPSFEGGTYLAS